MEVRQPGAIGRFDLKWFTVEVPADSAEPTNDAARLAGEAARKAGYETRFPNKVKPLD